MKTYAVKNSGNGKHIGYVDLGFLPAHGIPIEVKSEGKTTYLEIVDLNLVPDSVTGIQGILFGKIITKDKCKALIQEQLLEELKTLGIHKKESKPKGQVICRRHRPIPNMPDQIRYRVMEVVNSLDIAPETNYTVPELKRLMELYPQLDFVFMGWERT